VFTSNIQPRRAVAIVAVLGVGVAACGDDDDSSSGASNAYAEALAAGYKADPAIPFSDDEADCMAREFVGAVGGEAAFEAAGVSVDDINGRDNPLRLVDPSDAQAHAAGGAFRTCGVSVVDMLFEPGRLSDDERACIDEALTAEVIGAAFVAEPEAGGAVISQAIAPCSANDTGAAGGVIDVAMVDFAFAGLPESVPAGTRLTVTNISETELHEVVVFRLADDETRPVDELAHLEPGALLAALGEPHAVLLAAPGGPAIPAVGDGILTEPGRYALFCFIPTGADVDEYLAAAATSDGPPEVDGGPPHFVHGMHAELTVERSDQSGQ